jgi:hypothetical protein
MTVNLWSVKPCNFVVVTNVSEERISLLRVFYLKGIYPFQLIGKLYAPPASTTNNFALCIYVFLMFLTVKSDYFLKQRSPVDLCKGEVRRFLCGTDWILKCYSDEPRLSTHALLTSLFLPWRPPPPSPFEDFSRLKWRFFRCNTLLCLRLTFRVFLILFWNSNVAQVDESFFSCPTRTKVDKRKKSLHQLEVCSSFSDMGNYKV